MMTIDDEVRHLVAFLSHPAGFDVDISGTLCIRPIDENSPPEHWEVDWIENPYAQVSEAFAYEFHKEFASLQDAAQFFVEKRRYMCNGLDFEAILLDDSDVEIIDE